MKPYIGQVVLFQGTGNSDEGVQPAVVTAVHGATLDLSLLVKSKWGTARPGVRPDIGGGGWSLTDGDLERVKLDIDVDDWGVRPREAARDDEEDHANTSLFDE
jgi:hypothetical protein